MKHLGYLLFVLTCLFTSTNTHAQEPGAEEIAAYQEKIDAIQNALTKITGKVQLLDGIASLEIPEGFYYLSPEDSKIVLEELWGNPPSEKGLGMIFPAQYAPMDQASWAVTLDYTPDGYVSDEDAAEINYDELLQQMQQDTQEESKARKEAGYQGISLIGWAAKPYYDSQAKKLHWAKEIAFEGAPSHTLNYNIRVLGRKGVLILNFIANIEQLDEINGELDTVMAMSSFNEGNKYSDFNPDIDEVAAYGIGALVAGKVLAKTGILAVILIALKKFWFVGVLALWGGFKALFGRRKKSADSE